MKRIAIVACLAIAGCQTVPGGYYHEASTGRRVDADAQLLARFEVAKTVCEGEAMKAAMAGAYESNHPRTELVRRGCMAGRGFIVRPT